jgi:hypothetical protein
MRKKLTSVLCTLSIICTLACFSAVHADDKEKTLYAGSTPECPCWQQTNITMSAYDYMRSVNNNQQIVQRKLKIYTDRLITRAGAYRPAINLLGSVVVVTATDKRYHLNDSNTMGMVFRDAIGDDRSVVIEYRIPW